MANLITKEQLTKASGGSPVSGVILCKNYSIQLTKNGKEYVAGELSSEIDMPFKAWSQSSAFRELKEADYSSTPVYITGNFDSYNGNLSIVIETISAVEGFSASDFLPIKYNKEAYYTALVNLVNSKLSPKGQDFAKKILFDNEEVVEKFKNEFAAASHHDNCKSGLLAHTYKVVGAMSHVVNTYPDLIIGDTEAKKIGFKDLLFLGALLHDIGKIDEMNFGIYQAKSVVTHRYLGIEYVLPFKDELISAYGEDWWYQLISIFLQHHGEFDDRCRTVAAFLIHKVDMLDSELTLLQQNLDKPVSAPAGDKVKIGSDWLSLN